ncbi:MAG: hypothetical protein ABSG94_03555 [Brevinematales bacterium]|jgi:hypothetical protein
MKKFLLSLPIVALMAVFSFGDGPQNALSVDLGPTLEAALLGGTGVGVSYERLIGANFSAMLKFSYIGIDYNSYGITLDVTEIDPGIEARFYISPAAISGFYIGAGFEDYIVSGTISGTSISGSANVPAVDILIGDKITIGLPVFGFMIEPYVGYGIGFAKVNGTTIAGFEGGARLGVYF